MTSDEAFLRDLSELLGTPEPSAAEREAVLDLTRVVAHSSERRFGPLTVYALALAMDGASAPQDRAERLQSAIRTIEDRSAH
ncbi:hypothetical protein BH23ACT9_BH23ACT9_00650 [soil metagenome]